MYNPKQDSLTQIEIGGARVFTTFRDLATDKVYELLIEPSERSYSYTSDYSKLPVIGTAYPLLAYKASEMTLSLPDVKFWTYGNAKDITPILKGIASLTQPVATTGEPPTCKMSMGAEIFERVKVHKFLYKVKSHIGGVITMAEGSIDILIDPVPSKLSTFVDPAKVPMKLSPSEQSTSAKQIRKLLEEDAVKAKQYNYTKGTSIIIVADDGKVTIDNKEVGSIKDILGAATPPALNNPQLTTNATKATAPIPKVTPPVNASGM